MNQITALLALLLCVGSAQAGDEAGRIALGTDQTLRLDVVAQTEVAGSCDVLLGFLDGAGNLMRDTAGHTLSKRVHLAPGQADYLEVQGRELSDQARAELAPAIQVEPENGKEGCPGVMAKVEVLDAKVYHTAMGTQDRPPLD